MRARIVPAQVKAMEMGRVLNIWLQLQDAVAGLMDSTLSDRASVEKQQGIRQVRVENWCVRVVCVYACVRIHI